MLTSDSKTRDTDPALDPSEVPPELAGQLVQLFLWGDTGADAAVARAQLTDPNIRFRTDVLAWETPEAKQCWQGLSCFSLQDMQWGARLARAVDACVMVGAFERGPSLPGTKYVAFVDPSGGGPDEHTLAIAHRKGEKLIVDAIRARKGSPRSGRD